VGWCRVRTCARLELGPAFVFRGSRAEPRQRSVDRGRRAPRRKKQDGALWNFDVGAGEAGAGLG